MNTSLSLFFIIFTSLLLPSSCMLCAALFTRFALHLALQMRLAALQKHTGCGQAVERMNIHSPT